MAPAHRLPGYALAPLGAIYGAIAGAPHGEAGRLGRASRSSASAISCVGGAGKTPTALEVASVCRKLGLKPGFLTRGYGGSENGPLVVVAGDPHGAPMSATRRCCSPQFAPTVVAGRPAERGEAARQPRRRRRSSWTTGSRTRRSPRICRSSWSTRTRGVGNGLVFPAGPLRAPLAAQIRRADALVVLGEGPGGDGVRMAARAGLPDALRAQPSRRAGAA